jgi:hypothetical protein
VLRSMLDLSWIDLIPVNNKIRNLFCIFLKKRLFFTFPSLYEIFSRIADVTGMVPEGG